jgi:lysophospholipase L1-like esterase
MTPERPGITVIIRQLARAALLMLALGPARAATAPAGAARIFNGEAIAPFLATMRQEPPDRPIRILQFGDSHTAADFWSGRIRARLQARYGDGGPGCILPGKPWRGYDHAGVRILPGPDGTAQSLRSADGDGLVGLTGASYAPDPREPLRIQAAFGPFQVQVLGPAGASVTASVTPLPASAPAAAAPLPLLAENSLGPDRSLQIFAGAGAAGPPQELSLSLSPDCRLLGVELLSGRPGVVYDELGLNGAMLLDLERWNPDLRGALLARARPDLIVLAYGTNDMGLGPQADYPSRARALMLALKAESGAPILVIGPLDRVGRVARQVPALKAGAAFVIQALKAACLEAGCAFWDAREAMGGFGSIRRWRRANLARNDLVHLTGPGYQQLGDRFADTLLAAVDRTGQGAPAALPGPAPRRRGPRHPVKRRRRRPGTLPASQ